MHHNWIQGADIIVTLDDMKVISAKLLQLWLLFSSFSFLIAKVWVKVLFHCTKISWTYFPLTSHINVTVLIQSHTNLKFKLSISFVEKVGLIIDWVNFLYINYSSRTASFADLFSLCSPFIPSVAFAESRPWGTLSTPFCILFLNFFPIGGGTWRHHSTRANPITTSTVMKYSADCTAS